MFNSLPKQKGKKKKTLLILCSCKFILYPVYRISCLLWICLSKDLLNMPAEWLMAASACLHRSLVLHCYKWPHIAVKQDGKESKAESSLGGLWELFESWCQLVAMVSHSSSLTLLGSTTLLHTENCVVSIALIHCKQSPRSIKNSTTSFLKADASTSASWSNSKLGIYI